MSIDLTARARSGVDAWNRFGRIACRHPSFPVFAGVVVVWLATVAIAGRGLYGTLSAALLAAAFLVIAGIGQMFVITSGNGGIDLSVPYVMTLTAYISCQIMSSSNSNVALGIIVGVLVGAGCGAINAILVEGVGMPPLVATLAVGFGVETAILIYSGSALGVASPALQSFTTKEVWSIPLLGLIGVAIAAFFGLVLKRTTYGRELEAVGQSPKAASLAGAHPRWVRASAFVVCGTLAALAGILLAANSGGPSPDLGTPYQLDSIAVVVLGGTLISGGRAHVAGVWAAALLITLLGTFVNVTHLSGGLQDIVEGGLIVIVLALSHSSRAPA